LQFEGKDQGLLDLTADISYITFKNKVLDAIIKTDLRYENHGFDDFKHSKKTKLTNKYFDRVTSKNLVGAVQQAVTVLTGIKENILKLQIDQETIDYYSTQIQSMIQN
jgi:hypothetical protein